MNSLPVIKSSSPQLLPNLIDGLRSVQKEENQGGTPKKRGGANHKSQQTFGGGGAPVVELQNLTMRRCSMGDPAYGREAAWKLLREWTESESLRKHALAVEACLTACGEREAARLGVGDRERAAMSS